MALRTAQSQKHSVEYKEGAGDLSSEMQYWLYEQGKKRKKRSTSSSSEGKILRVRKPSENLSKTPVNPFIKETFSSRVFAVKFERSRKLRVEIGSEEKKG